MIKKAKNTRSRKLTGLEPWVHAVGADVEERLTNAGRERVLNVALRSDHHQESLPSLFSSARRLWLAGALPLALALLIVTTLERRIVVAPIDTVPAPVLRASKAGDQIRFVLENGNGSPKVVRSTDPRRIKSRQGVAMRHSSYAERLHDRADLVFYRVD